jgi:hypothetical protein
MPAKFVRLYRTYSFIDKNPVIDRCRTILQDEGLFDNLGVAAEIATLRKSTLKNWFFGETRSPQHASVAALLTSVGYEEAWTKKRGTKLDIDAERKKAAAWLVKHPKQGRKGRKK